MTHIEHWIAVTEAEIALLKQKLEVQEEHLDCLCYAFEISYPTVNWWIEAQASGQFKPKF